MSFGMAWDPYHRYNYVFCGSYGLLIRNHVLTCEPKLYFLKNFFEIVAKTFIVLTMEFRNYDYVLHQTVK